MSERPIHDPQVSTPVDANAVSPGKDRVNLSRRRFARSGAAAPVVLGSLMSKPALASIPYNCSISGQMSGNTSARIRIADCKTLGKSPGYWKNNSGWPAPYVQGSLPYGTCSYTSVGLPTLTRGTVFGGLVAGKFALKNSFLFKCEGTSPNFVCKVYGSRDPGFVTCNSANKATLLQVLNAGGGTNENMVYELGRITVASILNSKSNADFPLTVEQIVEMFNAVIDGGTYTARPGVTWTDAQVVAYLKSLYT